MLAEQMYYVLYEGIGLIGVAVIAFGALKALYQLYMHVMYYTLDTNAIRVQFGESILLGLEFMVAADIIGSLVTPDYYNLGMLAIIVAIRSVLSYFLTRELDQRAPKATGTARPE